MSLSKLATFDNSISANILRTKLESEGIICFLYNEHFTNLMPHYFDLLGSGVLVMVPTDQLKKAKRNCQTRSYSIDLSELLIC